MICDGGNKQSITYGSYKIFSPLGEEILHKQVVFGFGTSNLAEYMALISGLTAALEYGILDLVVLMDSNLVIHQVNGDWRCNEQHLLVARNRAREIMKGFDYIILKKVKRNIVVQHLGH